LSAHAAPASRGQGGPLTAAAARFASQSWLAVAIAVAIVVMSLGTFQGGLESLGVGGLGLTPNITLQMSLTLGGGILVAAACALAPRTESMPVWGFAAAIGAFVLAGYTALSVAWSVDPANSWLEASRTFAYAATFAGAIALARLAASRWRSVLAGALLATVAISAYALAAKVIPESLDASDAYARLSLPFGYWNAVGLTAALGIPPCLWLGARREGHGVVNALAAPMLCGLLITLMLSVSRGALIAALIGVGLWFVFVPLRLRALALLAVGGVCAAAAVAYAYSKPALSNDYVGLGAREYAGHRLGLVVAAALLVAFAAALVLRFAAERHPLAPHRRRQFGIAALVALALVPVAGVGVLAHSSRGLVGSISHAWNDFTNPNTTTQPSANPTRLIQAGNDHALYWSYALDVWEASPAVGAGAGAYPIADQRFMRSQALSLNAHSYVFQTLADLGIVGLLVSLAFAAAWTVAAVRTTGLRRRRAPGADSAERIGLLTMLAMVVIFTIHSAIDWTWFVPADAVLALALAGWLAGRGPHERTPPRPARRSWASLSRAPVAAAAATAIAIAAIAAWAQWQPLRSEAATNAASIELGNGASAAIDGQSALAARYYAAARADALSAISRNPLDITALNQLGTYYADIGNDGLAQATIEREVALQPSNAQSWWDLADYESSLGTTAGYEAAYSDFSVALYLDPQDLDLKRDFLSLQRPAS